MVGKRHSFQKWGISTFSTDRVTHALSPAWPAGQVAFECSLVRGWYLVAASLPHFLEMPVPLFSKGARPLACVEWENVLRVLRMCMQVAIFESDLPKCTWYAALVLKSCDLPAGTSKCTSRTSLAGKVAIF